MRFTKILMVLAFTALPATAVAAFDGTDLPADSTWYFHVDFSEMRDSKAGNNVYAWLDDEVFEDIEDETGIDLGREADRLTAYSIGEDGFVMVIEGDFTDSTRDKVIAAAATADRFDTLKSGNKVYYRVEGDGDGEIDIDNSNIEIDGIDDTAFFSFAVKGKILVSSSEERLKALLENGGKINGQKSHEGALFVLTGERSLIQAGLNADDFESDDDEGFKSNVMRNTKQVAFMVADVAGKLAIEAQLITSEPETAESLASIVRGLIALQIFSDDMDPDIAEFLRNTRVDVDDTHLKVSLALSPESVAIVLDEA